MGIEQPREFNINESVELHCVPYRLGVLSLNSKASAAVLAHLTDEKRKHSHILWVNLQEELTLEGNGQIYSVREPTSLDQRITIPTTDPQQIEDFDRLLEAMKSTLAEDSHSAFVFNCSNGKGQTTTATVAAVLTLWHFNGFPEFIDDEIVSVPDAKYTKGEFEVVMQLVRLLPDGHKMKREVDMALDSVSETMTPMHYHLREVIICTYRQIKSAKTGKEAEQLLLRSLQYLERYIYLILFNTYLHLEKKDSWQRSFTQWMLQVAARAGVYDILNQLGFSEFENPRDSPLARLRHRWQRQDVQSLPFRGQFI